MICINTQSKYKLNKIKSMRFHNRVETAINILPLCNVIIDYATCHEAANSLLTKLKVSTTISTRATYAL